MPVSAWERVQPFFEGTAALRAMFHFTPSVLLFYSAPDEVWDDEAWDDEA